MNRGRECRRPTRADAKAGLIALWMMASLTACGNRDGDGTIPPEGLGGVDGGVPDFVAPPEDFCAALISRTCGANPGGCESTASCQAARLIDRYEPDRCEAAWADSFVYPSCDGDACGRLVAKVCGGETQEEQSCLTSTSCGQANDLQLQLHDDMVPDAERTRAEEACTAALQDDVVFPACSS